MAVRTARQRKPWKPIAAAKLGVMEHDFQRTVAEFLDLALPKDTWWTATDPAIKEGGRKGFAARFARKRRGIKPGTPDVLILWRGRFITIELKRDDGSTSAGQNAVRDQILRAGGAWHEARTLDEVEAALRGHGMPLSTTAGGYLNR